MAGSFGNGVTDSLVFSLGTVATSSGTVVMRNNLSWSPGAAGLRVFWSLLSGTDNTTSLKFYNNGSAQFTYESQTAGVNFSDTGAFTSGTWQTWIFVWNTATPERTFYVDNVSKGTSSTGFSRGNCDTLWIGNNNGGHSFSIYGSSADFGLYLGGTFTAADRAAYQAGYAANTIRPDILVAPVPMIRTLGTNLRGAAGTVTGATAAVHPRVIMPRRRPIGFAGTSPPPPPPSTYIGARFQMIGSGIQQFSGGRAA